jgi:hypothetical protein
MKGYLESVMDAHTKLGLPIDENTQKLLDQASAAGIVKDAQMSMNDIMMQGLSAVIKALGGDVPDAFTKAQKAADDLKAKGTDATTAITDGANAAVPALKDMGAAGAGAGGKIAKTFTQQTGPAADAVATAVVRIGAKAQDAASTTHDAAAAMVTDWGAVENAATGVAEGHSPSGIKQIIVRTEEAQAAVEEAAKEMVASFGDIFVAATRCRRRDLGHEEKCRGPDRRVPERARRRRRADRRAESVHRLSEGSGRVRVGHRRGAGHDEHRHTALHRQPEGRGRCDEERRTTNSTRRTRRSRSYTDGQKQMIAANLASGMSIDGIAKKTGLSTQQIQDYLDAVAAAKDATDKLKGGTGTAVDGAMLQRVASTAAGSAQMVSDAMNAMGGGAALSALSASAAGQTAGQGGADYTFNITIEGPTFWDDPNSVRPLTEAISQQLMDRLRQTRQLGL